MPFLRDAVFPAKIIYVKIHKNYVYLLQITAIYDIILLYVTVWLHFADFLSKTQRDLLQAVVRPGRGFREIQYLRRILNEGI